MPDEDRKYVSLVNIIQKANMRDRSWKDDLGRRKDLIGE